MEVIKEHLERNPNTNASTESVMTSVNRDLERQRAWFLSGQNAYKKGYSDTSPFYENATADYFFKCGYDGVTFTDAQSNLADKIKEIFTQDSTLVESVNELTSKIL